MSDQDFRELKTLCLNESIGDLRKTEKRLIAYLASQGVTMNGMTKRPAVMPDLPAASDLAGWPDLAKRRLGVILEFVWGLPPFRLHPEAQGPLRAYMDALKGTLDPELAFRHTWYAGDRPANPLMDEIAQAWGLAAGVHPSRLFQGLKMHDQAAQGPPAPNQPPSLLR